MSEYGPDFFRYYLDRLDEKISYPDPRDTNIMDRIPPKVQQQMQKNMEKRSQAGLVPITSPADLERITKAIRSPKEQELWHTWGATKCGMSQNYDRKTGRCVDRPINPSTFEPPEGFDPCPARSQKWDPETRQCVDARPQIDPENFRPPTDSPFFDPCPGRSQKWDPETRKCVPDTDLPIINIIDPMSRGRK